MDKKVKGVPSQQGSREETTHGGNGGVGKIASCWSLLSSQILILGYFTPFLSTSLRCFFSED